MPKTLWVTKGHSRSGISVTWTKSKQRIDISGWYDSCVGIEGESFALKDFFDRLGISEKDCIKAFRKKGQCYRMESSL